MLCEAAWVLVRTPGPLRAFYERVRARRGAQIALVATARKLSVLFWHLLTRAEDYAFGRPSLTRRKLRELELKTEKGWRRGRHSGPRVRETKDERQHGARVRRPDPGRLPQIRPRLAAQAKERCGRDTGARVFKSSS
jgi:transposase